MSAQIRDMKSDRCTICKLTKTAVLFLAFGYFIFQSCTHARLTYILYATWLRGDVKPFSAGDSCGTQKTSDNKRRPLQSLSTMWADSITEAPNKQGQIVALLGSGRLNLLYRTNMQNQYV